MIKYEKCVEEDGCSCDPKTAQLIVLGSPSSRLPKKIAIKLNGSIQPHSLLLVANGLDERPQRGNLHFDND
jgi:hypothetical protein